MVWECRVLRWGLRARAVLSLTMEGLQDGLWLGQAIRGSLQGSKTLSSAVSLPYRWLHLTAVVPGRPSLP